MLKPLVSTFAILLCLAGQAHAADEEAALVGREIGAVLGWRLGPEALEERCRGADPDGAKVRADALKSWQQKNDARIRQVDERVAEVVALLGQPGSKEETLATVRAQVKAVFLDNVFGGKNPEQIAALCKAEADPHSTTWTSNGMPQIQVSLAELYDWTMKQQPPR